VAQLQIVDLAAALAQPQHLEEDRDELSMLRSVQPAVEAKFGFG